MIVPFYARLRQRFDRWASCSSSDRSAPVELKDSVYLSPPPVWSRLLIWTLGSGSVVVLVWACLARVDEKVVLTGQLVTSQGVLVLRSPVDAYVDSCPIVRHQFVSQNDVLCELVNESVVAEHESLIERIALLRQQLQSTDSVRRVRVEQFNQRIQHENQLLKRMDSLLLVGAVQEFQVLEKRVQLAEVVSQKLAFEEENRRQRILVTLQMSDAMASLKKIESSREKHVIAAPADGYIHEFETRAAGFPVQSGEPLVQFVASDSLIAKVKAPSRLNSEIAVGDSAEISIDAYPSQDYGYLRAVVQSVSPTTVSERSSRDDSPIFQVRLALLPEQDGSTVPLPRLQSGMGLTARISQRSRPMITYVFEFMDKFLAPISEKR